MGFGGVLQERFLTDRSASPWADAHGASLSGAHGRRQRIPSL